MSEDLSQALFESYSDPYSMLDERIAGRHLEVRIGSTDVSDAVVKSSFSNAINERPKGALVLRTIHPSIVNVDWRGRVSVANIEDGSIRPIFTGNVVSVKVEPDEVNVECDGSTAFAEARTGACLSTANARLDLVFAVARESGMRQDMVSISIPVEVVEIFEVIIPVQGLARIGADYKVGNVVLTSREEVLANIDRLDSERFGARYRASAVYAISYQTVSKMYDAEQRALGDVSAALAWVSTRAQYSMATLPGGTIAAWSRNSVLSRVELDSVVFVRGLTSQRAWIREVAAGTRSELLRVDDQSLALTEPSIETLSSRVRQSILSYQRAIREDDPAGRATLMWEAIEFYAGKTKVPRLFSRAEMKRISRALPSDLSSEKAERLEQMLSSLNSAPLLARLRVQLARDSVPFKEAEFDNLHKLRGLRNSLVHGRYTDAESLTDQIDQGLALVARVIVHTINN